MAITPRPSTMTMGSGATSSRLWKRTSGELPLSDIGARSLPQILAPPPVAGVLPWRVGTARGHAGILSAHGHGHDQYLWNAADRDSAGCAGIRGRRRGLTTRVPDVRRNIPCRHAARVSVLRNRVTLT